MKKKIARRTLRTAALAPLALLMGLVSPAWAAAPPGYTAGFEYAYAMGQNSGAYGTDSDFNIGGSLSVPIFAADPILGQELMGEILLGYAQTKDTGTFSPPLVVAGLPAEPTAADELEVTTFQVGAGIKYKLISLKPMGILQIQPYLSTGAAFHVFLARTNGTAGDRPGGIVPISPELADRGFPTGQGNVLVGAMYGVGTDFVLLENLLLGVDARWNAISRKGADYSTVTAKVGFRF